MRKHDSHCKQCGIMDRTQYLESSQIRFRNPVPRLQSCMTLKFVFYIAVTYFLFIKIGY